MTLNNIYTMSTFWNLYKAEKKYTMSTFWNLYKAEKKFRKNLNIATLVFVVCLSGKKKFLNIVTLAFVVCLSQVSVSWEWLLGDGLYFYIQPKVFEGVLSSLSLFNFNMIVPFSKSFGHFSSLAV